MPTERIDPPHVADERTMLTSQLDWQRATLQQKCDGLSDEQLRAASAPPSKMSLLGLVRHMAEVERSWFRMRFAGEPIQWIWVTDEDPDAEFDHVADADVEEAFSAWREQIEAARRIVAEAGSLDETFEHPRHGTVSLRWVLVHMIEEYARHNGHADLIRERIDGATGY